MSTSNLLTDTKTISKYLGADNSTVKNAVASITSTVQAAANQSVQVIRSNRERISDSTDHLDGVLVDELSISMADEIKEITAIAQELDEYYDHTVSREAFPKIFRKLDERIADLEKKEKELQDKEAHLEKIIHQRVTDAEERVKKESTSSKGLFESALLKSERVFDQNKITRFVCSTISRFQDEFERIQADRDVEHVTRLFQETIEPFQTTKVIADKEGKLTKVITNSFSEDCYQDLFLFFYKYYNELMDIFDSEHELPSTAEELSRIFKKKKKGAEQIIAQMHKRK